MKHTPERSKRLLVWLIECRQDQNKLRRERNNILNMELNEEAENKLLAINSERTKEAREFERFCLDHIVGWHLTPNEQKELRKHAKTDNTATMAVHGW